MAIKLTGPIGGGAGGGAVTSVNGATGAVNLYADNAVLNLAGDGIVVNGAGAASTLDVDSGTTAGKIVKLDGSAKLPAVDGSQLTNLPSAAVSSVAGRTGAVVIYTDDVGGVDGTGLAISGTGATSALNVDVGTTASKIVQLDGSARLPAVDGSQLTNLPSAPVSSVAGRTGAVVIYSDDVGNVDGTGLTITGTGATSALNVDAGTGANQIVQLDGSSRLPAVDGSQLTNLPSAPVSSVAGRTGAVVIYSDDVGGVDGTGLTISGTGATSALNVDAGTGANQIVQLDGSSRLPAVDGSQLTNLPSAPVSSVAGRTGAVVIYSDDVGGVDGTGLTISGTGATSALNVDVGTTASKIVQLDGSARLPAVDGSQLTNLPSAPVSSVNGATGAVNLYADDATLNLAGTGIVTSGTGATSTLNVDVGTTASKIVQLDGSARLPAVDGSQLTNLPSAPVTSVNGATGAVNLYADDATLNLAGTGIVTSGTGATSTLNVDVGTTASKIVQLDGSARLPAVDGSQLTNVLHDVVDDTTPQLGGDLDVQARVITTSTVNGSIGLEPDGTGSVVARGTGAGNTPGTLTLNCEQNTHGVALQSPPHASAASYTLKLPTGVGTSGQALTTDGNTPAQLSWTTISGGGGSRPTVTTDSSGTDSTIADPAAADLEDIYLVDNTTNAVAITLPTVTSNAGYKVQIKRLGTANVTVTPASGTIDGAATQILSVQYAAFTCTTDGTNWFII